MILVILLGAAAAYSKATLTIFPPLLLLGRPEFWRGAVIYFLIMSLWWARNYSLLHEFIPFSTISGSLTAYLGNNPSTVTAFGWTGDAQPGVLAQVDRLSEIGQMRAYNEMVGQFFMRHPIRFLWLTARRVHEFLALYPHPEGFRAWLAMLVGLAAYTGAWRTRKRWRILWPLYAAFGYMLAIYSVTAAVPRYRLPVEPIMLLFAASWIEKWKRR